MERLPINNLGIPPLAGLCSYAEACCVGYSVEQNVELLKRYNYVESQLNQILAAHLCRVAEWEVKCAISLHLWLDAEHSAALRKRVGEMREPPLHLDKAPDARLTDWLEEVIRAENTVELLVGVYRIVKAELVRCLKHHLSTTNPLIDRPTCRVLRLIVQEEEEMIAWGEQAVAALAQTPTAAENARAWESHLRAYLAAAGGVSGDLPLPAAQPLPQPRWDGKPYAMEVMPQRDARFTNSFDQSHWQHLEVGPDHPKDEIAFAPLNCSKLKAIWRNRYLADVYLSCYTIIMTNERWTTSNKAVFNIGYHLIWCPKYRRKVLTGQVEIRLKELLTEKANELGITIENLEVMPDHTHLFIKSTPVLSPHYIVQQLKGYTSHELRKEFPHLKSKLPTLWTRAYYCESVGHLSAETIKNYIDGQKNQ